MALRLPNPLRLFSRAARRQVDHVRRFDGAAGGRRMGATSTFGAMASLAALMKILQLGQIWDNFGF